VKIFQVSWDPETLHYWWHTKWNLSSYWCWGQFPNSKFVRRYHFRRAFCFLGFVHCFWHSEDKKWTNSITADNKHCLYQTDFLCNSGKGSVLSNSKCNLFQWQNYKKSTLITRQIRDKFPESKPRKYGIKLWVAADAENFYAWNMQVQTGRCNGVREKKQDLQVVKVMVCHM